jgi:phosphate/sulfate permease
MHSKSYFWGMSNTVFQRFNKLVHSFFRLVFITVLAKIKTWICFRFVLEGPVSETHALVMYNDMDQVFRI